MSALIQELRGFRRTYPLLWAGVQLAGAAAIGRALAELVL